MVAPHTQTSPGLITLLGLLAALACASPAVRLDNQAAGWGFERHLVEGEGFQHVVYRQAGLQARVQLHIYLEGDGLPWRTPTEISRDPTPRRPFALELMHLDPTESVYLGRPCYHGLSRQGRCSPALWTDERYSTVVIDTLETAVRQIAEQHRAESVVLIGYSGGGVLAVLLAERLEAVAAVVTVAANLNVDRWSDLHGYTRLRGSLNPTDRSPLPPNILQIHLAGDRDTKVPVTIVESFVEQQPDAELRIYPTFDHLCCWTEIWPSILEDLTKLL